MPLELGDLGDVDDGILTRDKSKSLGLGELKLNDTRFEVGKLSNSKRGSKKQDQDEDFINNKNNSGTNYKPLE